jgi:hypothetical protein
MPSTATLLLPYPAPTDPADVPTDMGELAARIETVRGAANGLAGLDATGKVPVAQLPAAAGGGEIAYAQITATVNIASTTDATGTLVIAPGAIVFDGGAVIMEFFAPFVQAPGAAAAYIIISLFEGATQIGRLGIVQNPAAVAFAMPFNARRRFTPTAGSHTYTVTGHASQSTGGQVGAGAGGTGAHVPAFVRFTRV